jgi:predicted ATPase
MARLDRLSPVKEVAQIGACVGRSFSHDLLAAVSPLGDDALSDALQQLVHSELVFRRGTNFTFKHALVQDTAYASLLKSRRQQFHGRIAVVLEDRPGVAEREPELLAHHFAEAGEYDKAVAYCEAAGQRYLAATTLAEAAHNFGQAIDLLPRLPETPERDRAELRIRIALATTFMALKGWAASEFSEVLPRARDIGIKLQDSDSIVSAQSLLALYKIPIGDYGIGSRIAEELLETGEAMADPRIQIAGAIFALMISYITGKQSEVLRHQAFVNRLFLPERDANLTAILNHDPKCITLSLTTYAYWILGRYREARAAAEEQLAIARTVDHPWNLIWSLAGGTDVVAFLGDWQRHVELIAEARELARKYELPFAENCVCAFHEGFARIAGKDFAAGEQSMRQGLDLWAESGGRWQLTEAHTFLAEALMGLGRYDEALANVTKAGELMEVTGERYWEPEIYRVRGEIELLRVGGSTDAAEAGFRRALDVARDTQAKTWELRAATSLARLWRSQGKPAEARDLLTPVTDWFTEGIDTPELKEAKTLLVELR